LPSHTLTQCKVRYEATEEHIMTPEQMEVMNQVLILLEQLGKSTCLEDLTEDFRRVFGELAETHAKGVDIARLHSDAT